MSWTVDYASGIPRMSHHGQVFNTNDLTHPSCKEALDALLLLYFVKDKELEEAKTLLKELVGEPNE